MSRSIKITPVKGNELYRQLGSSDRRWSVFVLLYVDDRSLSIELDSIPAEKPAYEGDREGYSRARWPIPPLRAEAANALLQRIAPLAERMCKGDNYGDPTVDAERAFAEITALCANITEDEKLRVVPAAEYMARYGDKNTQRTVFDIKITTSADELNTLINRIESVDAHEEGVDAIHGLHDYVWSLWGTLFRRLVHDVAVRSGSQAGGMALEAYVRTQLENGVRDVETLAKEAPKGGACGV